MKSEKEIEALKANWLCDPIWDIEDTEGFEDHREELRQYREEVERQYRYGDKRYFSFQYSFWDSTKKRNRPGVWNIASAVGFPQAEKLLWDIEAYLLSMNVNVEKDTVCLGGWQEFNSEEDYLNFTK